MPVSRPASVLVPVLAALLVAVAVAASAPAAAQGEAQGDVRDRGIRVVGVGKASGTPDVLRFTVGVEVTADTVDAALSGANSAATSMIATLERRGVAERDLQTASVQVHPRYDDKGEQLTGYVVRQDLVVTVRDLGAAGELIGAAVDAGGNAARLHGLAFALEQDEQLLADARDEAYAAALRKAEQYARLSGKELGEVLSIVEDVQPGPMPFSHARAEMAAGDSAVPIQPGSTEVSVSVEVLWAMR